MHSSMTVKHKLQDMGRLINHLTTVFHEIEVQLEHELEMPHGRISVETGSSMLLPEVQLSRELEDSSMWFESEADNTRQTPWCDTNGEGVLAPNLASRPSLKDFGITVNTSSPMSSMMSSWRYHLAPPATPEPHENVKASESSFCEALLKEDTVEVERQLEVCGQDPNLKFCNITVCNKNFTAATPLAVAVLLGNSNMVQMLAAHGASLGSTYSFMAGAEQQIWEGPITHATVPSGNLALLTDLVELKADVNAQGSNDANLAWQSAYFGHVAIMNYLVKVGVALDVKARSQDDSRISHTPLHVAVVAGHLAIVATLLGARAEVLTDDGRGRAPLYDAVRFGHSDMVKRLIESKGNPFDRKQTPRFSSSKSLSSQLEDSSMPTCLERAFESRNEVLLTKIAKGLRSVPTLLADMSKDDFLDFLTSPGEASIHAMEAVFQPHVLRYWEEVDGKFFRRVPRQAYVDAESHVNIMDGPHVRMLTRLFNKRKALPDQISNFVDKLLPQKRWPRSRSCHVPVLAYMCLIQGVHMDLRVLLALADCPNTKIYATDGCCVIINQKWRREQNMARLRLGILGIEVMNFALINYITDETRDGSLNLQSLNIAIAVSLVSWSASTFLEAAQALGYLSEHLGRRYAAKPRYWFSVFVAILSGGVNIALLFMPVEQSNDYRFRTAFGVLVFLKWIRFLASFIQVKAIGIKILPITESLMRIFPFLGVLGIWLIATVNMFYSLNNGHGLTECFLLIYQLVVLGEIDLAEFENQIAPPLAINLTTNSITLAEPNPTEYYHVVRIMMVAASFVIGVAMMNLFVAMLCLEYSCAYEEAEQTFMKTRANIVLDQHAVRHGVSRLFCRRRQPPLKFESSDTLGEHQEDLTTGFLWFAQQAALNDE